MAAQGFRPLVVDWDVPGEQENNFALTDYMTKRLTPILHFIQSKHPAPVHVLGYCMGGLLALALAALRPERVKSLILMATPWDFHQPDAGIGRGFCLSLLSRLSQLFAGHGAICPSMSFKACFQHCSLYVC